MDSVQDYGVADPKELAVIDFFKPKSRFITYPNPLVTCIYQNVLIVAQYHVFMAAQHFDLFYTAYDDAVMITHVSKYINADVDFDPTMILYIGDAVAVDQSHNRLFFFCGFNGTLYCVNEYWKDEVNIGFSVHHDLSVVSGQDRISMTDCTMVYHEATDCVLLLCSNVYSQVHMLFVFSTSNGEELHRFALNREFFRSFEPTIGTGDSAGFNEIDASQIIVAKMDLDPATEAPRLTVLYGNEKRRMEIFGLPKGQSLLHRPLQSRYHKSLALPSVLNTLSPTSITEARLLKRGTNDYILVERIKPERIRLWYVHEPARGDDPIQSTLVIDAQSVRLIAVLPDHVLCSKNNYPEDSTSLFTVSTRRLRTHWTPITHRLFDERFRVAVRTMSLLQRADDSIVSALPRELLYTIYGFL